MTTEQPTFELIKQSKAYANRDYRELPSVTGGWGAGCGIAFVVIWCLLAAVMTFFFYRVGGWMAICPGTMAVFGIFMLFGMIRRMDMYAKAPTQAVPAIVVSKHSRGSGDHSRNYITLEFESGQRQEFRIGQEREAALLGVGDAGVAYTRLDVFLAFDRC